LTITRITRGGTDTAFQWNAKDFNPTLGGLIEMLHYSHRQDLSNITTLMINLKTTGVYVYPDDIDLSKKNDHIKVEAEVSNETGDYASITLSAIVVDCGWSCKSEVGRQYI